MDAATDAVRRAVREANHNALLDGTRRYQRWRLVNKAAKNGKKDWEEKMQEETKDIGEYTSTPIQKQNITNILQPNSNAQLKT